MDDSPDWRPLFDRLIANRKRIAVIALLAAALSIALDLRDPARYRAEVMLTVAKPDEPPVLGSRLGGDPTILVVPSDHGALYRVASLRTYPELVLADGIAEAVRDALARDAGPGSPPLVFGDLDDLRDDVEARVEADGAVIALRARGTTPRGAARIANTWAEVFIARMDDVLGTGDPDAPPELRVASPAVPVDRWPWGVYARHALAAAVLGMLGGAALALARGGGDRP